MSIRPIDLQVLLPRVTEVSKIQQISDRQMLLQQQHFAEQWINITNHRTSQVQNIHKSETKKVHAETQNEKSFAYSDQQHETDQSLNDENIDHSDGSNHPSNDDPIRGHVVDIKT